MNTESQLGTLDRALLVIVRYGLFAVFFLPFVVTLSYLYPWVSGKIWGLLLIVEILFPLYVLLAFRRREWRPATNGLTYALLAWFAVITLSAILGDDLHRSIWSKPDRLTGLFFQYHLLAFFLMAGAVWRGKLRAAVTFTVSAATLMALIGFFQSLGAENGRGEGRLGNPSYLGQYLVPHVFLAAWLWWKDRASMLRIVWSVSGIFLLIGIYATKSKGALLGLFIGLLLGAIIAAFKGSGPVRKWARIAILALAASVLLFFAANKWSPTAAWLYDNRLAIQYYQETSGSRKLLVANAVETFNDRPLLGWGPENFESGYYYHYAPETIRYTDYETRQDRPHNLVLELLANFGILGILAYAILLFFAVRPAFLADPSRRAEGGILAAALIAQVAVNLFIFETPVSYIMFFAQLAFLAAFAVPKAESGEDDLKQGAVPAFIIVAAVAIWAMSFGVIGTIKAAKYTAQLIMGAGRADAVDPVKYEDYAKGLLATKTPYLERDIRAVVSNLAAPRGQVRTDRLTPSLELLTDRYLTWIDRRESDFVYNLVAVSSVMSLEDKTPDRVAALEKAMGRVKALAPNRQEVFWYEAAYKEMNGDLAGAEAAYRHAVDLYPDSVAALGQLAAFYMLHGRPAAAVEILAPAWPRVAASSEALAPPAGALYRMLTEERNTEVLAVLHAAERSEIGTFEWYMGGLLAAAALGDDAEAERIAEKARAVWPEKTETVDQILRQVREDFMKQDVR